MRNTSGLRNGGPPDPPDVIRVKIATRQARLRRYRAVSRAARGSRLAEFLEALRELTPDELAGIIHGGRSLLRTAIDTERVTLWRLERRLAAREGAPRGTEHAGATGEALRADGGAPVEASEARPPGAQDRRARGAGSAAAAVHHTA